MNKRISTLALAFAALAATAENPHFSPTPISVSSEPFWKRKICKSCKLINKYTSRCDGGKWTSPQHQACDKYQKKKK